MSSKTRVYSYRTAVKQAIFNVISICKWPEPKDRTDRGFSQASSPWALPPLSPLGLYGQVVDSTGHVQIHTGQTSY